MAQQQQQSHSMRGSHASTDNNVELFLNIGLEYKVNQTRTQHIRNCSLTPLILSTVGEWMYMDKVKGPARKVRNSTILFVSHNRWNR